jgi:hypothetical protein
MLKDFSDFGLDIDTITKFEFDSFLNDIKILIMKYTETELKILLKLLLKKHNLIIIITI